MAKAEYKSAIRSRKLIKKAVVDLLYEKPLDKITVTDVVKRADINRGTFYAHYTDISSVLDSLVEDAFSTLELTLRESPAGETPDPLSLLTRIQEIFERDLEFYRKVLTVNVSTAILERLRDFSLNYMAEHEKDFSNCSHDSYTFIITFFSDGLVMMYRDWFAGHLPLTLNELTQKAAEVIRQLLKVNSL